MASIALLPMPDNWKPPTRRQPPPQTQASRDRAQADMYAERINAGLCPICEPVQVVDDFGFCPKPSCPFAAFALPLRSPSSQTDPRR